MVGADYVGAMPLYLVRHAKAGSRQDWTDDDELRPLSKSGRRQADGIANALAKHPVPRILSSPYVRCVQTVEPLAAALSIEVEVVEELAEDRSFEPVLALLAALADHSVLCSHGDVIPATIDALVRRGMAVAGPADWRKGTTWVLERDGDLVVRGRALPPPA
jgi:phosphohistidine phosphatase SixA